MGSILPPEIFSIIISHVPLRPRLHVVSMVCKRWREFAVASVHEFPPGATAQALSLFHNLTTLDITESFKLPENISVSHFRLTELCVPPDLVPRFSGLTGLTRLAGNACHSNFMALLQGNAATLRTAHLTFDYEKTASNALQLPSLTSLTIVLKDNSYTYMQGLLPLCTQLGALNSSSLKEFVVRIEWSALTSRNFLGPFVRQLLALPCTLSLQWRISFHRSSVWQDYDIWELMDLSAHLVRDVYVHLGPQLAVHEIALNHVTRALAKCTQLRSLELPGVRHPVWEPVASQLTRLWPLPSFRELSTLPYVRAITVTPPSPDDFLRLPMLGVVREMTLSLFGWNLERELELLSALNACPRLMRLLLVLTKFDTQRVVAYHNWMRTAEQRGLEDLRIRGNEPSRLSEEAKRLLQGFHWLQLRDWTPRQ